MVNVNYWIVDIFWIILLTTSKHIKLSMMSSFSEFLTCVGTCYVGLYGGLRSGKPVIMECNIVRFRACIDGFYQRQR